MFNLLGEYDCKLDPKGRLMLPAGLRSQLDDAAKEGFVLNRDIFEPCLVLYPMREWNKVSTQIAGLNRFIKKNALFIRKFNNGATPIDIDGTGRILIPKPLAQHAAFEKDLKVCGNGERIELWSKANYDSMLNEEIDFGSLSEEVMGTSGNGINE